jgi:hypothetical protein
MSSICIPIAKIPNGIILTKKPTLVKEGGMNCMSTFVVVPLAKGKIKF